MRFKILLLLSPLLLMILISGCDNVLLTGEVSDGEIKYAKVCINGVEYLKNHRGFMSTHFKRDGTLYLCNEEKHGKK